MSDIFLRPANREYPDPVIGEIKGVIPEWLNGCLLRNGPGILKIGSMEFNHLFDSLSVMHRFNISKGQVTYQNRFLQSDSYKQDKAANLIVATELATRGVPDPCKCIFKRYFTYFFPINLTDNDLVNFNVYGGEDEIYVASETTGIHRIDPSNLETKEKINLSDYIGILTATAHTHTDKENNVFNIATSSVHILTPMKYCIVKYPPAKINEKGEKLNSIKQATIISEIDSKWGFGISYFHSFGITENYIIFVEQPLYLDLKKAIFKVFLRLQPPFAMFTWDTKQMVQIHVINKHTGERLDTIYEAEPFSFFHHINAYEKDNCLIMDIICSKNADALWAFFVKNLKTGEAFKDVDIGKPKRFVIPLQITKVAIGSNIINLPYTQAMAIMEKDNKIFLIPELLSKFDMELPRIHYENFNGRQYQFFYAVQFNSQPYRAGLIKVDIYNKTEKVWFDADCFPSEPVFVARPGAIEEDDGVILSSVLRISSNQTAFLLILDAKTFVEVGRSEFKIEIPKDLHGIFLSETTK